jgi:hypothetical protein
MCIEYHLADRRLKQWADWLHEETALKQLGYPTCSPEQKTPGTQSGRMEKHNQEAEEVERLLSELKFKWYDVYQALMAYYFIGLSVRASADRNRISPVTFQKYLNTGMGWMEAMLSR